MTDTIAAIATAPGRASVGIVRVSGPQSMAIAEKILGFQPKARYAHFSPFFDNASVLDEGIALFFKGPNSFTGEDVLELQGHGGPVILDMLLETVITNGARLARPGEFSERAFLNDKLDLLQAEAIADLIDATSRQAVQSAIASLTGEFSRLVDQLVDGLIELRMHVEAAIDFPDEDVDFLADSSIRQGLDILRDRIIQIRHSANQGSLLREGLTVVLAGKPNAGKSSLLNALCGKERAIVTDIAGTTRDVLSELLSIDGLPLHVVDTAGLRRSEDVVEKIGIQRAYDAIKSADKVLLLVDASGPDCQLSPQKLWEDLASGLALPENLTLVWNKMDLVANEVSIQDMPGKTPFFRVSAKTGQGLDGLKKHLKESVGYEMTGEGVFMARRRHLDALESASGHLDSAYRLLVTSLAGELVAEELRLAQSQLEVITGRFTPDDLLSEIFSSFCMGK